MNLNSIVIGLLIILVIFYVTDMKNIDNFRQLYNSDYESVNYNTRMENGVETVVPKVKKVCKDNRFNNDDVRERYLARNVKLNQTIPVPNNTENIEYIVESNTNKKNVIDDQIYENIDIKSFNSMMYGQELNTLSEVEELLTLN
jgi:hypothetical protein